MEQELISLFRMLEYLARMKFKAEEPMQIEAIRLASGSCETGYFIYLVGGTNATYRSFPSMKCAIAKGVYEPGIYVLDDCPGGVALAPENKVSLKMIVQIARWRPESAAQEELRGIIQSMRDYLRRNGLEVHFSDESMNPYRGLRIVQ